MTVLMLCVCMCLYEVVCSRVCVMPVCVSTVSLCFYINVYLCVLLVLCMYVCINVSVCVSMCLCVSLSPCAWVSVCFS